MCGTANRPVLYGLTGRFDPAPPAQPGNAVRLELGNCVNLSNTLDASEEGALRRRLEDADNDRIAGMGHPPAGDAGAYYETVSEAFASIGVDSCALGYANTFELWDSTKGGWQGDIARRIAAPVRD